MQLTMTRGAKRDALDSLSYSPQLDGLRAFAVLAVFIFHINEDALPGGFLGVDLFFVLSGYLITRLLVVEFERAGTIDLPAFWARRFRRLMPASIPVLLAVIAYTTVWGAPSELLPRRDDVLSVIFYVANWHFIGTDTDYFASSGAASPLRHTWTLAVEEQFYFVWPIVVLIILAATFKRFRLRGLLVAATVGAIVSAAIMFRLFDEFNVSRSYFGTDARIHQMLVGAIVGMLQAQGRLKWKVGQDRVQAVLLGLVVAATFVITGTTRWYYGIGSLVFACIAAILISSLIAAPTTLPGRTLQARPLVYLGKISYAFYLWHWPIIVWVSYPDGADFGQRRTIDGLRFVLVLALSVTSQRLVEDPIRKGHLPIVGSRPVATIVAAAAVMLSMSWITYTALSPDPGDLAAAAAVDQSVEYCPDQPTPCVLVDAGPDSPVVVTIGDSSSQHLSPAFEQLAASNGFTFVQAGLGGCSLDARRLAGGTGGERFRSVDKRCFEAYEPVMEYLIELQPDVIVASSRNSATRHLDENDDFVDHSTDRHFADVRGQTGETLDRLLAETDAEIVIIDSMPRLTNVDCLAENEDNPSECDTVADAERWGTYNELLQGMVDERSDDRLTTVSLDPLVCPDGRVCPAIIEGTVASYDGVHFTRTFALKIAPEIEEILTRAGVDLREFG